jgi:hypothetical protein
MACGTLGGLNSETLPMPKDSRLTWPPPGMGHRRAWATAGHGHRRAWATAGHGLRRALLSALDAPIPSAKGAGYDSPGQRPGYETETQLSPEGAG